MRMNGGTHFCLICKRHSPYNFPCDCEAKKLVAEIAKKLDPIEEGVDVLASRPEKESSKPDKD